MDVVRSTDIRTNTLLALVDGAEAERKEVGIYFFQYYREAKNVRIRTVTFGTHLSIT